MKLFARFVFEVRGATAIEYGLIAGLLAVGIISGFGLLGTDIQAVLATINDSLAPK